MQIEILPPLWSFVALVLLVLLFCSWGLALSMVLPLSLLHLLFCHVFPILKQILSQPYNAVRLLPFLLSFVHTHLERELCLLSLLSLVQSNSQLLQSLWLLSTTLD